MTAVGHLMSGGVVFYGRIGALPMRHFDWIFFDIGGTLVDESSYTELRLSIDIEVLSAYREDSTRELLLSLWQQACAMPGSIDTNLAALLLPAERAEQAAAEIRRRKKAAPAYVELARIRPEAEPVLAGLAQSHKLGIIANQGVAMRDKLSRAGLLRHFSHQGVSDEYRFEKPDPRIYEAVLRETGANPLLSVMVDDNIERSLAPAKRLGMTTVWYRLEGRETPEGIVDGIIASLKELPSLEMLA